MAVAFVASAFGGTVSVGTVVGEGECAFRTAAVPGLPEGWFEQEPDDWLAATTAAVLEAVEKFGAGRDRIAAIGVTSTSGTLCPVSGDGRALGRAIMYSDSRSGVEAEVVQAAGEAVASSLGYRFKASFGLPKILWLKGHDAERFDAARWFISPTDLIIGRFTGRWGRTDQTNALKYGYDLVRD